MARSAHHRSRHVRVAALLCLVAATAVASCTWNPDVDTRSATQGLPNTKVDLVENAWRLDPEASTLKLQSVVATDENRPTIDFHPDGTVSGRATCNSFHGTFTVDDDSVTIEKLATTLLACEEPVMDDETAFVRALESEHHVKFSADHDTLTLTGSLPSTGKTRLVFASYDPYG